jgi:hypothetical protein
VGRQNLRKTYNRKLWVFEQTESVSVLADTGFDIAESVGLMYAYVKIPAFTKGPSQLKAKDLEETMKIAHLRIHVERVIGNLGGKYKLLTDLLHIKMVLPCKGEEITFLYKVVVVYAVF